MREDSERDVGDAVVFPLALGERVRVRENSERDSVPYGCSFGHGYKKGRFGTDPYDIFHEHRTSGTPPFFPSPLGRGSG